MVNSKIGELHDTIEKDIIELEQWLNKTIFQSEKDAQTKKERCEICSSQEQLSALELHHIAGRKHDYRTITSCLKCHRILSDRQKIWDKRWLVPNQPMQLCTGFFLIGLYDILTVKAEKTCNSTYKLLAGKLVETISILLR